MAWVSPSCRSCTPSQQPLTRSALSPCRQPCKPGSAPGKNGRIRWKGGKADTVHLLFHLDANLDRHLHTFLFGLKVGNLQFFALANNVSCCQDHLFDDIDAVFKGLWSTLHVRNCLQDIEAIYSRNLPTFLLGDFPEI